MPPRLDMANFRQSLVPTAPSPVTSSTVASESLATLPSAEPVDATPSPTSIRPPQTQNQEPPTQQAVVPVIVVGLQSVNSDWRPDMPPPDENDMDVFGHPHGGGAEVGGGGHEIFGDDDDFDGFGNSQQHHELLPDEAAAGTAGRGLGRGRGRARGWQSRAANAIRNLRPGRRPPPPGTQYSMTTPGSRTFLIYVIGGLYFFLTSFIIYLSDVESNLINSFLLYW